jgi:asparagine synthase (glutamine-hydrolysing)
MCGLNGIFAHADTAPPVDQAELLRTREHMFKRGPDGAGLWIAPDRRIGLGHRRLAIIDLSADGAQPMATPDGRYQIVFNGEIYNYRALQAELVQQGASFRSHSDTEVLLQMYARHGQAMCRRLRGMYAFAIWDTLEQTLFLARDPFGIKPLYVHDDGQTLRFASQVKALLAGGAVPDERCDAGTTGYWMWGHLPEPYTLTEGVQSLPAGTWRLQQRGGRCTTGSFDSVEDMLSGDTPTPYPTLHSALLDSVRHHLIADVPVGIFLSAGIDSAVITAMAAECTRGSAGGNPLHTVTLGFEEFKGTPGDETVLAEQLARQYGTQHHTVWVTKTDFEEAFDTFLNDMDQPTIDGLNTWLVSRAAAKVGLKVALSGLGGDEFFGGYPSFQQVPKMRRMASPFAAVPGLSKMVRRVAAPMLRGFTSEKMAGLLEYGHTWEGAYALRRAVRMPWETHAFGPPQPDPPTQQLQGDHAVVSHLEVSRYMRSQLLRDSDWAAMAHSLELRVPLVDAVLARHIAQHRRSGQPYSKQDLAAAAQPPMPTAVSQKPKTGFVLPTYEWAGLGTVGSRDRRKSLHAWQAQIHRRFTGSPLPMRVLAIVTDAYGGHGGIAKFNRDLVSSVAAMPGCSEVVCLPVVITRPVEGVPRGVTFIAAAAGNKARYVLAVLKAMRQGPYGMVLVGHVNMSTLGTWVARRLGVPCVLFVHGIDVWTPHKSPAVRRSLPLFDRVVGVSQHSLDRFNHWAGLDPTRQRVLPNCVDLQQFTPGPKAADLVQQYGLQDRTVLMTFGRLASEERFKGFDEVMEVLPALAKDIPNLVYLVCGGGPDLQRLQAKAKALGLEARVRFTGFVDEQRKADHYRLADAYVMPSRGEGFGIVFLEALACGVPVMGSTVDGSREALLNGKLGELVHPAQADEVRLGILRTLARERGDAIRPQEFSVDVFAKRVGTIVQELSDGHAVATV